MRFPVGKLPLRVLERLLRSIPVKDAQVVVGPGIGEDAAVIDTGGPRYLIAKTDPITFTIDKIGWYAVNINANDIATMGGRPRWFLATLLLPQNLTGEDDVERIFQDIEEACGTLGISLIGGHTEITYGLGRPIVVGQMLGEVDKDKLIRTAGALEGDAVILTKGVAIEGTAILAREKAEELAGVIEERELARARDFLFRPGISVVKEALVAVESGGVHSMHDPTEGGLATALHEVARAAGVGLVMDLEAVPVFPETRKICDYYHLNPLGFLASGALLIITEGAKADQLLARLAKEGIPAFVIGEVVSASQGIKLRTETGLQDLTLYEQDELTRVLR